MPKWFNSKVIRIEDETPTTKRFWVEVEDVDSFDFKAGQFITMDLPVGEKRRERWRSYSIANAPDGTNVLEFCIVYLEGGRGTTWFFDEAKLGSHIKFKGPAGTFVLPEEIEHDLVFICTGTGVAPFRSMIGDICRRRKSYKGIHLIFGTRHTGGILYREEFEKLVADMPGFQFDVALSREENLPETMFGIHSGYVHPIYLEKYAQPDPNRHFYLCGWTEMVDEARKNLADLGYDSSQVNFELYG